MKGESVSIRVAGTLAGVLGGLSILICVAVVPSLLSEISSIRSELDSEMAEFRLLSNDMWSQMMRMGGAGRKRARRAAFNELQWGWGPRTAIRSAGPPGYGSPASDADQDSLPKPATWNPDEGGWSGQAVVEPYGPQPPPGGNGGGAAPGSGGKGPGFPSFGPDGFNPGYGPAPGRPPVVNPGPNNGGPTSGPTNGGGPTSPNGSPTNPQCGHYRSISSGFLLGQGGI